MFESLKKFWRQISGGPRERQALAFLRMATGLFFLYQGHHKLTNPDFAQQLSGRLQRWAAENPIDLYRQFLEQIAVPHADVFACLVTYGEIGVGLSYVLGFLVAFSAPAAAFMNLNFLLAAQHTSAASLGVNLAFTLIHLSLFWGRAGRHYGFDEHVFREGGKSADKPAYGKSSKKLKAVKDAIEQSKKAKSRGGGKKPKTKSKPF